MSFARPQNPNTHSPGSGHQVVQQPALSMNSGLGQPAPPVVPPSQTPQPLAPQVAPHSLGQHAPPGRTDIPKPAEQITPRFQDLLEQLRGEFVTMSTEAQHHGSSQEADPKLIQQHMNDLREIRKTIFELHQAHQQLRDQYTGEITKLRNKLDELSPHPPIVSRHDAEEGAPSSGINGATAANGVLSQHAPPVQPLGAEEAKPHVPGPVVPPTQEEPSEFQGPASLSHAASNVAAPNGGVTPNSGTSSSSEAGVGSNSPDSTGGKSPKGYDASAANAAAQDHENLAETTQKPSIQGAHENSAGGPESGQGTSAPLFSGVDHQNSYSDTQHTHGAPTTPTSPSSEARDPTSAPPLSLASLNFDELPPQFKKEGNDYKVVYNPQIQRRLNIEQVHSLPHASVVCCVRFSHDGKFFATGSNHMAQIYDVESGLLRVRLHDQSADESKDLYIRSVCFSPDGQFLATGAEDHKVRIWDIGKRELVHVLKGHTQEIYSLAYSNSGKFLVSGSGDRHVKVWDVQAGQCYRDYQIEDGVTAIAISPDDKYIAAGSLDREIRIWQTETGELVDRLGHGPEGHEDSVYSVAYMPNGRELISGSLDRTAKIWELHPKSSSSTEPQQRFASSRVKTTIEGPSNYVLSVAVTPDSKWILSGSKDQSVYVWDAASGTVQLMLQAHTNSVISVAPSPDGKLFASGGGDSVAKLWRYEVI